MVETILLWGSIAAAVTAIGVLIGKAYSKLKNMVEMFSDIKEHTEENYLNNLRLVITSPYMPLSERLNAGEKYIKKGGNGEVKTLYKMLQKEYLESEE